MSREDLRKIDCFKYSTEKLQLSVVSANVAAIGLYRSLGFDQEGILRRHFKTVPGGVYHDQLVMSKELLA